MLIKRWLRQGEFSSDVESTEDLLEQAGRLLDKAYAQDITGPVLFQGMDKKYYVGTVEFVVSEASPRFVRDTKQEIVNENKPE